MPHYDDQAGGLGVTGLAHDYLERHLPFIALRDGQALVVDGHDMRMVE